MNFAGLSRVWRLAARSLWRDVRAGELRLLMASVALAVSALCAVAFLADRMQSGLWRDARALLGGDAVIVSDRPTPPTVLAQVQALGLRSNLSVSFPTMGRVTEAGGESRLVALKAVSAGYPLRGELRLQGQPAPAGVPAPGEVWVDPALLDALGLQLGQALGLGQSQLRISALIEREGDRGAGFMNFAPRVMLNAQDLPATGLVQPASRVTWRLAVADAGDGQQALRLAQWARQQVDAGQLRGVQVESLESGRPEMRQTLDRASQFLNLVALLSALLCAVAVALAARSYAERHLDGCALRRVLGQSQSELTWVYALEFMGAGLLASGLGVLGGYALHNGFVWLLQGLVDTALPAAGWRPAALGLAVGVTLLVAFGLPPVLQLAQVPALRVLRRDLGRVRAGSLGVLGLGLAGFAATLLLVAQQPRLGLITVGGTALAMAVFAGVATAVLWGLRRTLGERAPRLWRLATRQVASRPGLAVVQVSSLSLGLLALALLVLLRTDLVASWRQASPKDAPDRFVINVQPDQARDFLAHLQAQGVPQPDWFPMVRGRLVAVNGREVRVSDYSNERAQRLVDREFNLSYTDQLPAHNPLLAGQWVAGQAEGVSVEQGIADTLGLHLGDRLRFDMGGIPHEATITSLRKVDWSSMRANFFMLFPVADMPHLPTTWLAAFRSPADPAFERQLVQRFPNVTSVDMRSTLNQVQRVLDQVVRAVEFLFAFTLAAGVMVLLAAVGAGRAAREREYAILRAMGADRRLLVRMQSLELWGVGLLAGGMASTVALAVGWVLARQVFEYEWQPAVWAPLAGALCGGLLAWVAGSLSLAGVLRRPVVHTLRQSTE